MTTVTHYEDLTFPEVADLPRDLPLVLPLGDGYDMDAIASAVGVNRFCLLPGLPYGWQGSPLAVSPAMLQCVVDRIFDAPREEGFTRLIAIHAGDEDVQAPGVQQIRLPRPHAAPEPLPHASPERVILIPCGHTEQHGFHLPMNTDTVIIGAIARAVVEAIPGEAEMLPTLPYGVSMFRSSFGGTFNMGGRTFEDFLVEIVDALVARGADRFYLMSGHGGN